MLAITAVFAGAVLGLRFKVLVLVPALAIASATSVGIAQVYGNTFWSILAAMALTSIGLQLGYLGGTVLRGTPPARSGKHASGVLRPVRSSHR